MRHYLKLVAGALAIVLAWLGVWSWLMAGDVARVKASIDYQYAKLRTHNHMMSIEADAVFATGFPFAFKVGVTRATLSMVDGDETFAISIPELTLVPMDSGQGSYRVLLPDAVEALYAKAGAAPEHYVVRVDAMPKLLLSAADSKKQCGPMAGTACVDVARDAPLISYAVGLEKPITVHMQLGSETRDATFDVPKIPVPIYQEIPADLSRPLQLFVGVLREALVFKTP